MNDMMIFSNPEFGNVRTTEINGTIYFAGTDVAKALGYSKPQDAISRHCRHSVKHGVTVTVSNQYTQSGTKAILMNISVRWGQNLIMRNLHWKDFQIKQ